MTRILAAAVFLLLLLPFDRNAEAQFVRIGGFGGVSVRAPFVAVDVLPFGGGTRVRAPFTRVNTGAYRYGSYYYGHRYRHHHYRHHGHVIYGAPIVVAPPPVVYDPVPVYGPSVVYEPPVVSAYPAVPAYPSAGVESYRPAVPAGALTDRLRDAAARLAQSLSYRRDDADVWLDYLGPQLIVDVIDRGGDPSNLRPLVANYDGVVSNASLGSVRAASGFAETRSLLKQFLADAYGPNNLPDTADSKARAGRQRSDATEASSGPATSGEQPGNPSNDELPPIPPDPVPEGPVPPDPAPSSDVEPSASEESSKPRADGIPTPAPAIQTASGEVPIPL